MKRYLYMTFAVLGLLGSTVPHAEAGNLTGGARYLIMKVQAELF